MIQQSLQQQVAAARLGSREAFAALVEHYQGIVSAVALNIVGDFQQSEDIAQESFLIAWSKLTELSEPAKFPAWLCGIARNCSNNWLRQQKRNPLAQSVEFTNATDKPAVETEQTDKADAQLVWQSLSDIPETYREPMLMFYRHGAKTSEIADALELTEETVRQRLSRGRKLLKSEIERTVEKTLSATRPDVAFTVAVLAAIPLSATVGCSTTTKSVSFLGGVTAMSSIGPALFIIALVLFSAIPSVLFIFVCFYASWYAIKNSPTLRTRRFAISAALDMCILFWLIWLAKIFPARIINSDLWGGTTLFFSFLPISTRLFLFNHLPLLLVLSAFIVYIVLRWRQLLYEDHTNRHSREGWNPDVRLCSLDSRLRGNDGKEPSLLAKTLEREITFIRNLVNRYRHSTLTAPGICIKRNVVLGFVALFCVYYMVQQSLLYVQFFSTWEPSTWQFVGALMSVAMEFLFLIAVYALFFWIISKAIDIAWDDDALEKTPPKIPLSSWNESELRPEGRRKMLVDSVLLLCMVTLVLILMSFGSALVQEFLFSDPKYTLFSLPQHLDIGRLIMMLVVLVVLTVLWCSYNPAKRLLGFARLFLVGGLLAFCYIEWVPLTNFIANHYHPVFGLPRWETLCKIFFSWHLTAFSFLVYSLLAATSCYLLRAGER